eukprot:IDg2649t1
MDAPDRLPSPDVIDRFLDIVDVDPSFDLLHFDPPLPETDSNSVSAYPQLSVQPIFKDAIIGVPETSFSVPSFSFSNLRATESDYKKAHENENSVPEVPHFFEFADDSANGATFASNKA